MGHHDDDGISQVGVVLGASSFGVVILILVILFINFYFIYIFFLFLGFNSPLLQVQEVQTSSDCEIQQSFIPFDNRFKERK